MSEFFEQSVKLEFEPSLWRHISTPLFRKQMKTLDELTQCVTNISCMTNSTVMHIFSSPE